MTIEQQMAKTRLDQQYIDKRLAQIEDAQEETNEAIEAIEERLDDLRRELYQRVDYQVTSPDQHTAALKVVQEAQFAQLERSEKRLERIEDELAELRRDVPKPSDKADPTGDGWIPWHGGECPVDPETVVTVRLFSAEEYTGQARNFAWRRTNDDADIIGYRVVSEPEKPEPIYPRVGMVCWVWWQDNPVRVLGEYTGEGVFLTGHGTACASHVEPDHWRPANGPRDIGWEAFGVAPPNTCLVWFDNGEAVWVYQELAYLGGMSPLRKRRVIYIEGRPEDQDNG